MNSIKETNFNFPGQTGFYRGKVRDVYYFGDTMAMVASDRISAFDVVLPRAIPDKGRVLNQVAAINLNATKDIVPNWVLKTPDPNVTVGFRCDPFPVEMVVRGYLSGHAAREYKAGRRSVCGVSLPEGLKESDKLPEPIITPTTKAKVGHDEDISKDEILKRGLVSKEDYEQLELYTLALFRRGSELAAKRSLILVDTKYEFGKHNGKIYLIDEVHTPDSSRYWLRDSYGDRFAAGLEPESLDKEFVRRMIVENGYDITSDVNPKGFLTDTIRIEAASRYLTLFKTITGESIHPRLTTPGEIVATLDA
jgi:phosphoribosylaminoimidazole-succinocarboxamide synthase